jgi:hypothetical protein
MLHKAHSPLKRRSTYKPSPVTSQAPLIVKVPTLLLSKGKITPDHFVSLIGFRPAESFRTPSPSMRRMSGVMMKGLSPIWSLVYLIPVLWMAQVAE